ncbi:hypothetical protein B0H21DRAFT_84025 [Amylocystis lapponica]|nr:hypothetical protein B0H21DRAFT_84025 [Amylocystis lapponica]
MASHMSTMLSRTTSDILSHVSKIRLSYTSHIPLFTLSVPHHLSASDLSALVSQLTSLSGDAVGCLSTPIPSQDPQWADYMSCSVAMFEKDRATSFRSTIPGKQAAQVGRWHTSRKDEGLNAGTREVDTENLNWQDVWSRTTNDYALPPEVQNLRSDRTDSVIYLSDDAPEGLMHSLQAFSSATKLGLIASSTPFITGRPFTLFRGPAIYSSGAVGLCLSSPAASPSHVEFPGLQALTGPLTVTSSEGNLVHSLDNANPSRLLLSILQKSGGSLIPGTKDDHFYVGVLHGRDGSPKLRQVYHIISGDPSRGTLALESDAAPPEGSLVQLYRLPANTPIDNLTRYMPGCPASTPKPASRTLALTVAPAEFPPSATTNEDGGAIVLDGTFLAASENGFVVDRPTRSGENAEAEQSWRCTVPGGSVTLAWE